VSLIFGAIWHVSLWYPFTQKVILHSGTVIREEIGLSLDKADAEVLGTAAKVVITKDSTTIVGDGTTQEEVTKRVVQIKNQIEVCIV
jgi:chaperonin GroEL (HSP60 family)